MNINRLILPVLAFLLISGCHNTANAPLEGANIGGPFILTSEDDKPFDSKQLDGKYRLIYFGYTYCPDVCPIDMMNLMKGLQLFSSKEAKRGADIVPIFITLDPARDTPMVLKQWTAAFDPRLIGLTGSEADIDRVAKLFAIYFKREKPNEQSAYLVDHARMALLFGPKGQPIALISQDKDAATIADELDRWVQ